MRTRASGRIATGRTRVGGGTVALVAGAGAVLTGCVERTITITSEPEGALVWMNDREVGRTPVTVRFVHYGTYDVRILKDGYEPLLTHGDAQPPWWDNVGPDLVAELLPWQVDSAIDWHFDLEPTESDPALLRAQVIDRAREMREIAHDREARAVEPPATEPDG